MRRYKQGDRSVAPLFVWLSIVLVIAFLPVALYVPYLLLGGGNAYPQPDQLIISHDTGMGKGLDSITGQGRPKPASTMGAAVGGGTERSREPGVRVTRTPSAFGEVWRARARSASATVSKSGAYLLVSDSEAVALEGAGLIAFPIQHDRLRNPMPGLGGPLGEVVDLDPLCLTANARMLADSGIKPTPLGWDDTATIVRKTKASAGVMEPLALFAAILHQGSGRICDSSGAPTFHMDAGRMAMAVLSGLSNTRSPGTRSAGAMMRAYKNGGLPLLIGRRSLMEAGLAGASGSGGTKHTLLPLPQTAGGPVSNGIRRIVLTCYTPVRGVPLSPTRFDMVARTLSGTGGKGASLKVTGRESTAEELLYAVRHGAALESACQGCMANGVLPSEALTRAMGECKRFDESSGTSRVQ